MLACLRMCPVGPNAAGQRAIRGSGGSATHQLINPSTHVCRASEELSEAVSRLQQGVASGALQEEDVGEELLARCLRTQVSSPAACVAAHSG